MSVVSCLRGASVPIKNALSAAKCTTIIQREMGGGGPRKMFITPSRWQWHKFKDMLHFYVMLGAIPLGVVTLGANIFVGPAKLSPIPEDYIPNRWEYFEHPITRFLAKFVYHSHQQDYEKYLHFMFEENEKKQMRLLEKKVERVMAEHGDTQAYFYRPVLSKYHRWVRDEFEKLRESRGY